MEALSTDGNLNWEQRPVRELLKLSWPITLSTISYSLMTFVDTVLVSGLGKATLAGVGLGGTAAFVLLCFSFGLLRGVKTLVSQAVGAGKPDEVGRYLGAALAAAGAISVLTLAVGQVVAWLLPLIAATPEAGEAARVYLSIRVLGAPMALGYVALREVRYAQSDARSPMKATVAANIVNIVLAYLFVFQLHWGVAGAAIATVIAHAVELGMLALVQRAIGFRMRGMRARHLRELFKVGLPTGLQFTLEVGAFAILAGIIAAMSEVEMAAHQIAINVIHFSFLPAFAVAEAASVLGGQAVGANRDDLFMRVARIALGVTSVYTAAWTLLLAFGAQLVITAYNADAELAAHAVKLLHVAAVFQMFDGAYVVARAMLRGAGDVRYAAVVGVISSWVFTPPLTLLLGYKLGLGAFGGWLGLLAEIACGATVLWVRIERRRWTAAASESRARIAAARHEESPAAVPAVA